MRLRSMKAASSSARSVMWRSSGSDFGRHRALVRKPVEVRLWQPTLMLSSTDMRSNSATFWKVRPMPSLRDGVARLAQDRAALEHDVTVVGHIEAREAVEERGLARSVGTDEPRNLARRHVERDAVERHDAAEADRHVAHAQEWAGAQMAAALRKTACATMTDASLPFLWYF